jgi:polysaccharide export outer membrane protein
MKPFARLLLLTLCWSLGALAQSAAPAAGTGDDRRIAPQDLLSIVIVGESGLPTDYRVSASGEIQFPFIGVVQVNGLTPRELARKLEQELSKDYFVSPEVLVTVKEYRQEFVIIIGQVNRPGSLPLSPEQRMDILDAIARAGGLTRLAKNEVEFTRDGKRQTFKLDQLKKESDPAKKIWLRPGDILEVKEAVF